MPPAIIAAGIGAAGAIGGAVIGSHAQSSAANQAADAQNQAAQLQYQLGQQSLGLNQAIYNSNYGVLSPFVSRGNVAGQYYNALLGLPAAPAMQSPLAGTAMGTGTVPAPGASGGSLPAGHQSAPVASQTAVGGNPLVPAGLQAPQPVGHGGGMTAQIGQTMPGFIGGGDLGLPTSGPNALGANNVAGAGGTTVGGYVYRPPGSLIGTTPQHPGTGGGTPSSGGTSASGGVTAPTAQQAFNTFANSAGMQFQLQQGANALNNLYAAHGMVQSGAAMKGINDYAQQTALNNYFLPYMGMLGNQQAVGASAASSIAGVGQNFGNTAANINGQMGNALQSGADARSNAALASGMANANMWSGIGSSLGTLGSKIVNPSGAAPSSSGIVSNYHYTGGWGG